MTSKYYALLTEIGAAKLANATALGTKLQITQMAVGDGGGKLPTPGAKQTTLVGEKRRAPLNSLSVDPANNSQIVAEQIIPESEGGYWIRELGLFDADNVLIAVANCPETYKPQLQEGSGRTQTVRMILVVSSTEAVTLKTDPSVVIATRKYVDDKVIEVKAFVDAGLAEKMDKAKNGADIADVAAFINNLGLGNAAKRTVGTAVNQLPDMSAFYQSLNPLTGAKSIPGEFKIQYGQFTIVAGVSASTTITFPEAFLNTCVIIIPIPYAASDQQMGVRLGSLKAVSGIISKGNGDGSARSGLYLAIGY
ncbi:phage tail protein [Erwinia rhapontici]|uniref:phage tail protein n=1 Tax=Erwinia rhapontici TaxID=55212 RepID=UPI003D366804